jgi:hypothetical protein
MKITRNLSVSMVLILLMGLSGGAYAQRGDPASQQKELQEAMEMMKKQGMDAETQKQMEVIFKNMSEQATDQQSAKLKREQQEFKEETAGHGTAQVEVEGKQYELMMTECKITDQKTGRFTISARQAPGNANASLTVNGGGGHAQDTIQFSLANGSYEAGNPTFQLNGKSMEWQGMVAGIEGDVTLKFRLTCGAEMVDYVTPSKPNPQSSVNVLTLNMGKETNTFQTGYCSKEEYRTGNLIVEFEAMATGSFRGRPAIIFLSKSHAAAEYGGEYFHNLDLFLGELSAEQHNLPPRQVRQQIKNVGQDYNIQEQTAILKKYEEMLKSAPPEKKGELFEAQNEETKRLNEKVEAMRYPEASSRGGAVTVNGQNVHYRGPKMNTQDAARAAEFQDFSAEPEIWVTCGE